MKNTLFLLLTFLPLLASAAEPMRTFTDLTGRTTQAALVSVSGDDVTLQLANGQEATLKVSRFSAADQQYVATKAKELAAAPDVTLSSSMVLTRLPKAAIIFPQVQFNEASWEEVAEFFRVKSRDLDTDPARKGLTILTDKTTGITPPKVSLDLRQVTLSEALIYVAIQARLEITQVGDAVMMTPSADVHPPFPASLPSEKLQRQGAIRFPTIQFSGANLAEAAEFLQVKMLDLDPQHERAHLIIDPEIDSNVGLISLDAKDVPLTEALRYISALAKIEVVCLGNAYYFQPKK